MSKTIPGVYATAGFLEQEEIGTRRIVRGIHLERMVLNSNHHRSQAARRWHQSVASGSGVYGSMGSTPADLAAITGIADLAADTTDPGPPVVIREQAYEESDDTAFQNHIWKSLDFTAGRLRLTLAFDFEEGSVRWRIREAPSGVWSAYTTYTHGVRTVTTGSVVVASAGGEYQIEVDMQASASGTPCRLYAVVLNEADMLAADL